jgi:hypothetical protein
MDIPLLLSVSESLPTHRFPSFRAAWICEVFRKWEICSHVSGFLLLANLWKVLVSSIEPDKSESTRIDEAVRFPVFTFIGGGPKALEALPVTSTDHLTCRNIQHIRRASIPWATVLFRAIRGILSWPQAFYQRLRL